MTATSYYQEKGSHLTGRAVREIKRHYLVGWVHYSYRVSFRDRTSRYMQMNVGQLEGQTHEDVVNGIVRRFREHLEHDNKVLKFKLISVGGEKVNITIE